MTPENERKVEYLRSYQERRKDLRRVRERLEAVKAQAVDTSVTYGDIPVVSGKKHDLSDLMVKLDQAITRCLQIERECLELSNEIISQIEKLDKADEKDVLYYRYIKGYSWDKVAEKMGYNRRHATRIHGEALCHFTMPDGEL